MIHKVRNDYQILDLFFAEIVKTKLLYCKFRVFTDYRTKELMGWHPW